MQLQRRNPARIEQRQPTPQPQRAQDEVLAARMRAGEEQAFAELYWQVHLRVFAFALRRLHDPVEAEDVVQDVFLQVHRSIHQYEGRSSLMTWIFGIAYHEILHRFRRRSVETVPLDHEEPRLAAPAASIEESVDASRAWKRCLQVLQRDVTAPARHAFELRYGGCRSIEAIAGEMGKSAGAVRVALLRTRRTLSQSAPELQQARCYG